MIAFTIKLFKFLSRKLITSFACHSKRVRKNIENRKHTHNKIKYRDYSNGVTIDDGFYLYKHR